ncbi:MAG: B12-binding domain-containing radical SAM protein [Syntrophaceae bacterium]|nr:B12-binding domain-containing radical SAM protein [Syntrophaceae bacterium]
MSKILLIKPSFLEMMENKYVIQPMGLMYIGAVLKKTGHEVKIHDSAIDNNDFHVLRQILMKWKPDFIGISIIVTEVTRTKTIIGIIREIIPDVPVTLGGPWPSIDPGEAINILEADFVVIGEGEFVFPNLIDAINKKLPTDSVAGTASLVNGTIKINSSRYLSENELNLLPFPAWDLLDHNLYSKAPSVINLGSRPPTMLILTSRGCPYHCIYCHKTMGKVFRKRSVESVLAEIEELRFKYGFKEFIILDDCFNIDRERMYAILAGIRDRFGDVKLHFRNGLRADILEPEDMLLFKQAGTVSVDFAIETASPRLQKMIRRNLNIDKAFLIINAAVKAGIYTSGYFMIGFPTETYEEASATVEFAAHSSLHRAYFLNPKPFPGTELAEMLSDKQIEKYHEIDPIYSNFLKVYFNVSAMSDSEYREVFRYAYRRFYLNLKRVWRVMMIHPNRLFLLRNSLITLKSMVKT